ncbi:MAG: hypothetical protein P8M11_07020 [Planctomycetota bacterium]|nr:hypothetical protein [Planctomycetota bacterium]
MQQKISQALVLVGFVVATIGATGFHSPADSANGEAMMADGAVAEDLGTTEPLAWTLLGAGLAALIAGGFLSRMSRKSGGDGDQDGLASIHEHLHAVRQAVVRLDENRPSDAELISQIDDLRGGILFELGSQSDDFAAKVGFDAYASVWSHFATCERLLNRSWSMTADGHGDEGREELPRARAAADAAVLALEELGA